MYIPVSQTLPLKTLFSHKVLSLNKKILRENTIFFRYGRDALWHGLQYLNIRKGDNVLLPCSVCDVVLLPFLSLGVNVKYYRIDNKLNYDIKDIEAKIDRETKAIYLNHYFGFPQSIIPVLALCRKKNLKLIEDCAHSIHTVYEGRQLGSYGDISIFSIRKFFPIPDGGYLKINGNNLPDFELKKIYINQGIELVKYICNDLGVKGFLPVRHIKSILYFFRQENIAHLDTLNSSNAKSYKFNYDISCFSKWIINRINIENIFSSRRRNYQFWQASIESLNGIIPLFSELPEDVVPYCFPVLLKNRDEFQKKLERSGLYFEATLNYPNYNFERLINKEESFPDMEIMADNFLSLPVHQSLNISLLEKVRDKIITML